MMQDCLVLYGALMWVGWCGQGMENLRGGNVLQGEWSVFFFSKPNIIPWIQRKLEFSETAQLLKPQLFQVPIVLAVVWNVWMEIN